MTKLVEIQEAIRRLAPEEQQELRHWLYDATETEDPTLAIALKRQRESLSGHGTSRPYQEAIASLRAGLAKPNARHPAKGS